MNTDPYRLERFVQAQDGVHTRALNELRAGRKASHWMWFVFPQVAGLGSSPASQRYAIGSLGEARAYLEHPVLGSRLVECARVVASHPQLTAREIMGSPAESPQVGARAAAGGDVHDQGVGYEVAEAG